MAAVTTTPILKTRDWVVTTIRDSQQAAVETASVWAKVVEKATPSAKVVSLAKQIPSPKAIVDPAFDLAEKLLSAQRQFASSLVGPVGAPAAPRKTTSSKG